MATPGVERVLEWMRVAALGLCAAMGLSALLGWFLDIGFLKSIVPDSPAMVPDLAVALILLAVSAGCLKARAPALRRLAAVLLVAILLSGVAWTGYYVLDLHFMPVPLVPAPESVFCLLCSTAAVTLLLSGGRRFGRAAETLALLSGAVALISFTGHLTGASVLYSVFTGSRAKGMAINSSWAFVQLSGALLLMDPQYGVASVLIAPTSGGQVARRYIPLILVAPTLIELVVLGAARAGLVDPSTRHAFSIIVLMGVFLFVTWFTARKLDQVDRARQEASALLARNEERYRQLISLAPQGIFTADLDGTYVDVNEGGCALLGWSREEIVGRSITDLIPEDEVERLREARSHLSRPGTVHRAEWRLRNREGRFVPVEVSAKILPDGYWYGFVSDISERQKAQEALEKQAQELRAYASEVEDLYDNAPCGYHSLGPRGEFLQINRTELDWLGYSREELVGRKAFRDLLVPEEQARFDEGFGLFMERGSARDLKYRLKRKNGELLPILLSATAVRDRGGKYLMSRASVFDYTVQSKLESELQEALRSRDEFLSIAAHDLRTPISSLGLQLQLLEKLCRGSHATPAPALQLVLQTRTQLERLSRLVSDLLDLTRIRVGKLELQPSATSLTAVVTEVLSSFRAELEAQNIPVTLRAPEAATGLWDPKRIDQVVANLISNAIKYGRRRPIEVEVSIDPRRDVALLRVRDQGMGIPKALQQKIFERYERAAGTQKIMGLGLGLYITQQVVAAHGGRIWVDSTEGQGSTFTVELPRRLAESGRAA